MKRKRARKQGTAKRGSHSRASRRKGGKQAKKHRKLTGRAGKGKRRSGKRAGSKRRQKSAKAKVEPVVAIVEPAPAPVDVAQLKANNAAFQRELPAGAPIIELFRRVFRLGNEDFVWEMYRQVLQREPDGEGFIGNRSHLEAGTPKAVIAAALIQSAEAEAVFTRVPTGDNTTVAQMIQGLYPAADLDFIHGVHVQLLYREPDSDKVEMYNTGLQTGLLRRSWIASLILSEEFGQLIGAAYLPALAERGARAGIKSIGMFLCFSTQIAMDGEGIGRFLVRLSEGLLALEEQSYTLHVATTGANFAETTTVFSPLRETYGDRLKVHRTDSVDTVNRDVPADVWIVPYVGMALAQYLHKPFIVCLHDLVYMHLPELYNVYFQHYQYIHSIAQKVTENAAAVVFASEFTRNHEGLEFLKLPVYKTAVVRFAAPHEEYAAFSSRSEEEFRTVYKLFAPYITFPSVIRLHKNHERLIKAFAIFKQTELGKTSGLKLVFTDELSNRPRQQEILAALNEIADPAIRDSIIFLGRMASTDLSSLYKYATGTIVPTLFEGSCPFPILESLLMNTPVSFGRLEIVHEVISDMSSFATFDPRNIQQMADAIARVWLEGKEVVPDQKAALSGTMTRRWLDVAKDYAKVIEGVQAAAR
ncbi:Glycosyltransferase involved in cell wall bisynthesis [Paenibacillus algorifonticola]|uniref:Glycosyltransferase involved in cell wall bisynthesis n=1 Tax=Paenibacillus algorifonticola TaxID=684063 RepID=A0A1I1Y8D5_9BACL|nr:DUF4214 domain-containing protein [Paenibacillus algorifonticola]SFE15258.1 Glycosyltransferase involved in cell wall bisynthesis [Paenibacillus algorifonticola]